MLILTRLPAVEDSWRSEIIQEIIVKRGSVDTLILIVASQKLHFSIFLVAI